MDFTEQKYLPENPQEQPDNDAQPEQTQRGFFRAFADSGRQEERMRIFQSPNHQSKRRSKKNRLYQKHTKTAQKPVDLDIPQKTAEQPPDEPSPPQTKESDYNIHDAVQDNKAEFEKNADVDFSKVSADCRIAITPLTGCRLPAMTTQSKRRRLKGNGSSGLSLTNLKNRRTVPVLQKQDTPARTGNVPPPGQSEGKPEKSEQAPSGNIPFDRVAKFEQKAGKARAKADKAQQAFPKKTKIKKQRLYDEQKKKAKTRLKFEKEIRPQSDLYRRYPGCAHENSGFLCRAEREKQAAQQNCRS